MSWYVGITALNGRNDYAKLAMELQHLGIEEAWYYNGSDKNTPVFKSSSAHLMFTHRADAVAFALRHGGNVSTKVPGKHEENA